MKVLKVRRYRQCKRHPSTNTWGRRLYRWLVLLGLRRLVLLRNSPVLVEIVKHVYRKRVILVQRVAIQALSRGLGLLRAPLLQLIRKISREEGGGRVGGREKTERER